MSVGKRAVVVEPGIFALEEFSLPSLKTGEVLICTSHTLISPGTERAFFLDLPNTLLGYPLYPGYSNIGTVVEVGEGVDASWVGRRVASPTAHASHVITPIAQCLPIPDSVPDERASFFNLIAIAMQGVRKARIELGESVVVLGAGLIGLFAARLAQLAGGLPVISIDRDEKRLLQATRLGVDVTLFADEDIHERVNSHTQTDGAHVVIDATGSAKVVATSLKLARTRGRVIMLGGTRDLTDSINFYSDVHRKGVTIIGAHEITRPLVDNSPGYWTQADEHRVALALLERERIVPDSLITHRFTADDMNSAYELLRSGTLDALGMIVRWT